MSVLWKGADGFVGGIRAFRVRRVERVQGLPQGETRWAAETSLPGRGRPGVAHGLGLCATEEEARGAAEKFLEGWMRVAGLTLKGE